MATSVQTTYTQTLTTAIKGMLADDGPHDIESRIADGTIAAGLGLLQSTADSQVRQIASTDEPTSSNTLIASTPIAAATTIKTAVTTDFDGTTGQATFWPPRNVLLVLNSHANWDAGQML